MDEPLVDTEVADSRPPPRSGPWKLILLVAVLTLLGVWLVPDDEQVESGARLSQAPGAPDANEAPSLLGAAPTAPSLAEAGQPTEPDDAGDVTAIALRPAPESAPVVDGRPGARARAWIAELRAANDFDLDSVFTAAVQAQRDGETTDAYLLYFFAAREGHAGAARTLGEQADPARRQADDSVFEEADPAQAHKWYLLAAEQGDDAAQQQLQDLRQRIEGLAADGDPQAQRISLLWQ